MKYEKDIIILSICTILYITNQIFLKKIGIAFFNNYFNDLLAVPLYFSLINLISLIISNKEIKSFKVLFFITIILSFLGEYLAIYLRKGSVTDYLDILSYFIGLVIYFTLKNIKVSKKIA
ncbi:hypothetical protein [Methanobrevibacter ruminantium]|uniref:hypothetical protein n=1 Tax=Methanobrevibacter ruminantium TaxID=83816 RepID=UPI0026ED40BE|nr:hypothetical protein [Methanobrevibacter ruminantium]